MLNKQKTNLHEFPYLDTPAGIITPKGHVFKTTETLLKKHAGPLFEKYPLSSMLQKATTWIESTDGLGIVISLIFLLLFDWPVAVFLSLIVSLFWHFGKSALAGPALDGIIRLLQYDIVQFLVAVAPLSWFGMEGMYGHLISGILLFVVFKFGLIRSLAGKFGPDETRAGKPGLNDKVLNLLITRYAIREGITLPNIRQMESEIMQAMQKSETQRNAWRRKKIK